MKLKMMFIMMLLMQTKSPSLYQNLTFVDGKCKKENIVVLYHALGRAIENDIEDINAIDSSLLSGSNSALAFDFKGDRYYIPINEKIFRDILGRYDTGDTVSIDIVFLSQKDRKGIQYLSYVTSVQKNKKH